MQYVVLDPEEADLDPVPSDFKDLGEVPGGKGGRGVAGGGGGGGRKRRW